MNIGIGGSLSGGKGILTIALVKDFLKEDPDKKVISTMSLKGFSNYIFLSVEAIADFIIKNKDNQRELQKMFYNSILILDEIRNLISARKSTSNLNETMTQFLMMVGKLDCDVICTYQLYDSQVDKQFREIMDLNFECERTDENLKFLPLRYARKRIPRYTLTDQKNNLIPDGKKIGDLVPVRILIRIMEYYNEKLFYTGKFFVLDPMEFKDHFNTREIIILNRDKYLR